MAKLSEIITEMTTAAGLDSVFAEDFMNKLANDNDMCEEFVYYIKTGQFLCKNAVRGYSIIDILVWQVDHFKAGMDQGRYGMRYNECQMILKAFDTMFKMKADPDKYVRMITEETGQDRDDF